jgi:hypothetical protein
MDHSLEVCDVLATQERFSARSEGEAEATAARVAMKTVMNCILILELDDR